MGEPAEAEGQRRNRIIASVAGVAVVVAMLVGLLRHAPPSDVAPEPSVAHASAQRPTPPANEPTQPAHEPTPIAPAPSAIAPAASTPPAPPSAPSAPVAPRMVRGAPTVHTVDRGAASAQPPPKSRVPGCIPESNRELCGDGIDNNCDGRIDEGCAPPR